jgi:hypothetical protein
MDDLLSSLEVLSMDEKGRGENEEEKRKRERERGREGLMRPPPPSFPHLAPKPLQSPHLYQSRIASLDEHTYSIHVNNLNNQNRVVLGSCLKSSVYCLSDYLPIPKGMQSNFYPKSGNIYIYIYI